MPPNKVESALKIVVPRAVLEGLSTRAIREERKLEDGAAEMLERGAGGSLPARGAPHG